MKKGSILGLFSINGFIPEYLTVVLLFNYNVKEIEKWQFWGVKNRFFLKNGV